MHLASSAPGFWLRRHTDGTGDLFFDALVKLLRTYDAEFLEAGGRQAD